MLYLNRSTDLKNNTFWVAGDLNEETRRVTQLYLGGDVNGAIGALVKAGMPKQTAIDKAQTVLARVKGELNDEIKQALPWENVEVPGAGSVAQTVKA